MADFTPTEFLIDGAVSDPTQAILWVSDDQEVLDGRIADLATSLENGTAAPELLGHRARYVDAAGLLPALVGGELPDGGKALFDEVEKVGVILALASPEVLLDVPSGREFLERLRNALVAHELVHMVALTDQAGVERLLDEMPRLAACFEVQDFDAGVRFRPIALTVTVDAEKDAGWGVVLCCRLTKPAPAIDAYQFRPGSGIGADADTLQALGVEDIGVVMAEDEARAFMFTFAAGAAGPDESAEVRELAHQAALELIARPLADDEVVEITRMICFVLSEAEAPTEPVFSPAGAAPVATPPQRAEPAPVAPTDDISRSGPGYIECSNCGTGVEVTVWSIIDTERRPELAQALADGSLHAVTCGVCGEESIADWATLVWRRTSVPPLLYLPRFSADDPAVVEREGRAVVEELLEALGANAPASPMPIVVNRPALSVALTRDSAADVAALDRGELDVPDNPRYRAFLEHVRLYLQALATRAAVEAYVDVLTWGQLRELEQQFPDLRSAGVREALADHASEARQRGDAASAAFFEEHRLALETAGGGRPPEEPLGSRSELLLIAAQIDTVHPEGDPAVALGLAQRALAILDADTERPWWCRMMNVVGQAQLAIGDDAALIAAIDAFETVIEHTGPADGDPWIKAKHHLGIALVERTRGASAEDIERAIGCYDAALDAARRLDKQAEIALIESNRAIAYRRRLLGARAENLERAIEGYLRACELWETLDDRVALARTRSNLASAYLVRLLGEDQENHETAVELLEQAVAPIEEAGSDQEAAITNLTLGNALMFVDRTEDDIEEALERFATAIRRYRAARRPVQASQVSASLALAYRKRRQGDKAENNRQAVRVLEEGLEAVSEDRTPAQWAKLQMGLGLTRLDDPDPQREQAFEHLRASLRVFTPAAFPAECVKVAGDLGEALADEGDWSAARDAFALAVSAADRLYDAAALRASREAEITDIGSLHRLATYVAARVGDAPGALAVGERGRARWLEQTMEAVTAALRGQDTDPELRAALDEALADLRRIATRERAWAGHGSDLRAAVEEEARAATARLEELVAEAHAGRLDQPLDDIADNAFQGSLAAGEALVHVVTTRWGSLALIARRAGIDAVRCDAFTNDGLSQALAARVDGAEEGSRYVEALHLGSPELGTLLDQVLPSVGSDLVAPVAARLRGLGVETIVLEAAGPLGLLPLHAAPYPSQGGGTTDLLTEFCVIYTPSAVTFDAARQRAQRARTAHLVGVANPEPSQPPLPYAEAELADIARHFPSSTPLPGAAAGKRELLAAVKGASHVQLSCHGRYDVMHPMASYLELAGQDALTVDELLESAGFDGVRLVMAAACQSGMTRFTDIPDELMGFPASFLYAGTAGVVSALWPVQDLPAALISTRFYRLHLHGEDGSGAKPLPPAIALAAAQRWLARATAGELADHLEQEPALAAETSGWIALARQYPHLKPFADTFHWAPYVMVGA